MVNRATLVSAMAAHLPTGRGSPVSIHGLPALRELEQTLKSQGFGWATLQEFEQDPPQGTVVALWDFGSLARLPKSLEDAAQGRVVAWSLESPLVAHRGYHHLPKIARQLAHVVGYPGVAGLLGNRGPTFYPVGWPNCLREPAPGISWEERDLLVMINSNKRLHQWREGFAWSGLKPWARLLASSLIARSYRARRQWHVPDLYNERLRVVEELGGHPHFSLFGVGWDTRLPGWSSSFWHKVQKSYRGEVAEKADTLQRFRFAICIENTMFPGYISEKIFDALLARCIPVYLGAPDIHHYIPATAFIDLRDFPNYQSLMSALLQLDADTASQFLEDANMFLCSPAAEPFSKQHFLRSMHGAVEASTDQAL